MGAEVDAANTGAGEQKKRKSRTAEDDYVFPQALFFALKGPNGLLPDMRGFGDSASPELNPHLKTPPSSKLVEDAGSSSRGRISRNQSREQKKGKGEPSDDVTRLLDQGETMKAELKKANTIATLELQLRLAQAKYDRRPTDQVALAALEKAEAELETFFTSSAQEKTRTTPPIGSLLPTGLHDAPIDELDLDNEVEVD